MFTFSFPADIWSTQLDASRGYLAIETRDSLAHETKYSILDLNNFSWKLSDFLFDTEPWWCGLTTVHKEILLLHVFINSDNPDEKSYHGINIADKNEVWSIEEWRYVDIKGDCLIGQNIEDKTEVRSVFNGEPVSKEPAGNGQLNNNSYFPIFYGSESEHFVHFRTFITSSLNVQPELGCDYLEYEGHIIFSFYIRSGKGYECRLVVLNDQGKIDHLVVIEIGIQGLMGQTFFIIDDKLFFIRNKREICVYDLS